MMKLWIYRPDKANRNLNWSGVYNADGRSWAEHDRDEGTAYDYKVELLKKKLRTKRKHYIEDYWR